MNVSRLLKSAFLGSLKLARINDLAFLYRRGKMLVACYHGVDSREGSGEARQGYQNSVSVREFELHLEAFGRWFRFVDLAGASRWMEQDPRGGRPPLLITFDDGYRNNLTLAAPLLRRFGAPAVFFLTTGYIGTDRLLWLAEVEARVLQSPGRAIPVPASLDSVLVPREEGERRLLAGRIRDACKRIPNVERLSFIERLRAATVLDSGRIDHELNDFLSWDEARRLANMGFDIGSHTVEHPILSRLPSSEVPSELEGSRRRLEAEIGGPVTALAYPNGGPADYNATVIDAARRAGYERAFAVAECFHRRAGSQMEIRRMSAPGHLPPSVFYFVASGCRDLLRRR